MEMIKKTPDYEKLLNKYCADTDIFELIEQCILDEYGQREAIYELNGRYPEKRELIMKLKADLINTRVKSIKQAGGNAK